MQYSESLKRVVRFLQSLVMGHRGVESYFKSLEKTVESEEVKNKRLTERIELKKKEFTLKQRIQDTKAKGKKLEEEYRDYDPKADARRTRKIYGLLSLGMILLFILFRACASC